MYLFKWLKSKLLTIFGDIKIFPWPMFVIYDPVVYQLEGAKVRGILDKIQVGDLVCRGYTRYADGLVIPGKYSHSGIYVGDNTVIHAVAEGVTKCDILDFLMCDRAIVIRPCCNAKQEAIDRAVKRAHEKLGTPYDFSFMPGDEALYCHELTSYCYQEFNIEKHIATAFFGLIKKKEPVYLAQALIDNKNFETVIEADGKDKK